ncbi:uncharacterized protein FPRO_14353 [Fusarium proliferatum ET1]|uniref:Uncharacterized protein n=1 Tax=Fusarium proliferatum (strain ET1) TaxID=1227346 RepID=A0A1L7VW04_FUSPR|nr:uncharacterized protein FPRO_14353 [Fusarium proliferatum ET1]CZR44600.1 uncharacterized protein FPRO_14353 [Fusarium proliferatum ET1]
MTRSTKPVKGPEKKTAVGNLDPQILRQPIYGRHFQNTKATPKQGVRERKASEMTDEADPAAPPSLVASVHSTEAPSGCDPDLPSFHHLEDEYLLNPTTSYCFSGLFLTLDTDI